MHEATLALFSNQDRLGLRWRRPCEARSCQGAAVRILTLSIDEKKTFIILETFRLAVHVGNSSMDAPDHDATDTCVSVHMLLCQQQVLLDADCGPGNE